MPLQYLDLDPVTRRHALAELEEGAGAVITSTGMSAITLVAHLLGPDDLLVAPHDCYGGTYRLLNALAARAIAERGGRARERLTEQALARKLDVDPATIWRWRNGDVGKAAWRSQRML